MNLPLDNNFLALTAIVTFGIQFSFFVVAGLLKFDKVTDFAYGSNFVVLAIMTLCVRGEYNVRQIVDSVLVMLWGVRIACYLLMRIIIIGEDHRFDDIRKNLFKFALFWVGQFVTIWGIFTPEAILNAIYVQTPLQWNDYLGWALFAIGFFCETVADQQKFSYKNNPNSKGHWCDVGLWHYSRHPNYFGEILMWWGLFASCASVLQTYQFFSVLGPIYLTTILLFASGIPPLEKSADKRYWHREDYQEYKKSTSVLIPLPHFIYRNLPRFFKACFCVEFPMYTTPQEKKEEKKEEKNEEKKEEKKAESA